MSDLNKKTIFELSAMLESKACSSVEITKDVIGAIEANDEKIGAYLSLDTEMALAMAENADKLRAEGKAGKLLGIPLAIKDVLNVKGQPCTCGSKILAGYTAPYDATSIAKLRDAGSVFCGRVNMDEFAMGSSTENSAYKNTRNPWNLDHIPGGSSGGSAAAVAADIAIAALGTDTGGSIRQPAAFCGCVGLKPTYGRVSRFGLTAYASSLDQIGPITKDVRDAALLIEALSGVDKFDSTSVDAPVPDFSTFLNGVTDLKGMKLGLPKEYFVEGMDSDVDAAIKAAVAHCESLGAEIVEVSLPHTKYAISVYYILATAEASANLARFDGIRYGLRVDGTDPADLYCKTKAAGYGQEVKRRVILGTYVLSSGYYDAFYGRAQKARTLIRQDFANAFKQCDAILAPTAPCSAYKIGEKTDDPLKMYLDDILTTPASLAGVCGMSVPCGFGADGMPIGLQIIGPDFGEEAILKVGYAYEQSTAWHTQRAKF